MKSGNNGGKPIQAVHSDEAPEPIGPYSQAVTAGDFVFVSGQIPIDPKTGAVPSAEITRQTEIVIHNTQRILAASGLTLDNVVKVDIFVKDLQDFQVINEVYARAFKQDVKPARCVVQAAKLPKDVKIEMSLVAYKGL